jgi:multiple sugar transport system permease protein
MAAHAEAVGRGGSDAARAGRPALGDDPFWRRATLAPAALVLVLLTALPTAQLVAISFFDVRWESAAAVWTPVGLAHYAAIAGDGLVRAGLLNTVLFTLCAVAAETALGFALALLCSRVGRGKVVYQTIFLLPVLVPGIVIGAIWKLIYNYDFGLLNQALGLVGIWPVDWLGEQATALLAVIVVDIWHWTPFCFLLLLASLESLPQEVHEAARVDGASAWQELRHVTLPMLRPAIAVTVAFRAMTAFKVFDEVYLLTGGGPGTATEVVSFTIYRRFFTEDRLGYGSALAVAAIFAVMLLLAVGLSARQRRGAVA